jgi:hypothetical protein
MHPREPLLHSLLPSIACGKQALLLGCNCRFDSNDKEVNSLKEIPGDAKMLEKQFPGVVKVLAPRKDFGPATKLLPTLEVETDPETIIITVDVSRCCCLSCCGHV